MSASYAVYHALDWSTGETREPIAEEIQRVKDKIKHTYKWNEVGNATLDYYRQKTLQEIYDKETNASGGGGGGGDTLPRPRVT